MERYVQFHCVHLLCSSVQFEKIWEEGGTKGVGSRRSIRYLYAKSLPFYSIEFFGYIIYHTSVYGDAELIRVAD